MKKNIHFNIFVIVTFIFVVLIGCQVNGQKFDLDKLQNESKSSAQKMEEEVVRFFSLDKLKMTASTAGKMIEDSKINFPVGFNVTKTTVVSYDDYAGTITVLFEGLNNGQSYETTVMLDGFKNQYDNIEPSFVEAKIDFDEAIQNNTKFADFMDSVNNSGKKVLKTLTFHDSKLGLITIGEHKNYSLTAVLTGTNNSITITPKYIVKYLKKEKNGDAVLTEKDCSYIFSPLAQHLQKPYFSKDDVFDYLISKTDNIINVNENIFPSVYYALAKSLNVTPASLINDANIQPIIDKYNKDDGQFKMNIKLSILHPRNDGIKVDDYTGTVKIRYCVATIEQIDEMLHPEGASLDPIRAIRTAEATGFRKIEPKNIESLFKFEILNNTNDESNKTKWLQKRLEFHPFLRAEKGRYLYDEYYLKNPLGNENTEHYLTVNNETPENIFALGEPLYFSRCLDGENIFVEYIFLEKESNSDVLKIRMKFIGDGDECVIEKTPTTTSKV